MRINIASFGGRSHLLDTSRELEKFGHEIRFYSYIKDDRAMSFGLKKECNFSMYFLAVPFLVMFKICNIFGFKRTKRFVYFLYKRLFDYITAFYMKPCDVFIGQSPMHLYSLKYAKKKYNAIVILERGTSHVIEQAKALDSNPILKGNKSMPNPYLKYDLRGYKNADYISVGSSHVKTSFIKHGFSTDKLFVNNYGFDTNQFRPTILSQKPFDILIVGQWSHRKGADLLTEVCKNTQFSLLHVGSIIDVEFPDFDNMTHIEPVNQKDLIQFYSQARIFVLPSREEGLALVQAQAISCGLPLVCSKKTGGRDLKKYLDSEKWIIEMEDMKVKSLIHCISKAIELSKNQKGKRSYITKKFHQLSWEGYGDRYTQFLNSVTSKN